ncbi:MAG: methyl-accepting chemotaxis protein [Treponema sp.]|jgi:methyl-accepting chemotaxis protein|nr:methyl-accepting chemotaxis protein [Treponema sp.]
MLGQVLFFIAGLALMGAIVFPVLRSYKKRIRGMEDQAAESARGISEFRERTIKIAAALRESAGTVSLSGHDNRISGNEQALSMERIETTIDENARIAAENVEKIRSVAAIASRMEEDVLKGFAVLEKNVKKMGDIKEKNSGVINGIIALGNKVNKIRDIVRIISTITDQTKVIAFNAALEAASAGETGKRFAVVAGEVNRLADDIAVLTRQIREQVEEIQSSSSSLIVYSEEGSDRIAEGYKLIKDLEDIFREIRSGAEITSNQAQTITVSTQQQLKSSEQVNTAIAEVSQGVKHFIGAAEAAALSAGTLTERTNELERFLIVEEKIGQGEHGN